MRDEEIISEQKEKLSLTDQAADILEDAEQAVANQAFDNAKSLFEQGISCLEKALQKTSKPATKNRLALACFQYGELLTQLKIISAARQNYQRALELGHIPAQSRLQDLFENQADTDFSVAQPRSSFDELSKNRDPAEKLAVQERERALRIDSNAATAATGVADLKEDLSRYAEQQVTQQQSILGALPEEKLSAKLAHYQQRGVHQFGGLQDAKLYVVARGMSASGLGEHTFDLDERIQQFFGSTTKRIFLLLGNAGAGKSTYSRRLVERLIHDTTSHQTPVPIPLFINLPSLQNPQHNLMEEYLSKELGLNEREIAKLKADHTLWVVLDGYDEINIKANLYQTNNLQNWQAKWLITCRSQYIAHMSRYQTYFAPIEQNNLNLLGLEEAAVAPFQMAQIDAYIEQYIALHRCTLEERQLAAIWFNPQTYHKHIEQITGLKDLIKNPFLLRLAMEALPSIVAEQETILNNQETKENKEGKQDKRSVLSMTHARLYDVFFQQWFKRQADKVLPQDLPDDGHDMEEDYWAFSKQLAIAMYQAGKTYIEYKASSRMERNVTTWDRFFTQNDREIVNIRKGCPLISLGPHQYAFLHTSLIEYFATKKIYESMKAQAVALVAPNISLPAMQPLQVTIDSPFSDTETRAKLVSQAVETKVLDGEKESQSSPQFPEIKQPVQENITSPNNTSVDSEVKLLSQAQVLEDEKQKASLERQASVFVPVPLSDIPNEQLGRNEVKTSASSVSTSPELAVISTDMGNAQSLDPAKNIEEKNQAPALAPSTLNKPLLREENPISDTPLAPLPEILSERLLTGESNVLQFLADRVTSDENFKEQLFALIESSKHDARFAVAAANAATILNKAEVNFCGLDWAGIRIPGADLSGGVLDSLNLRGADLSGVRLQGVWLRENDLTSANLSHLRLGEYPGFQPTEAKLGRGIYTKYAYSPYGNQFAITENAIIYLFDEHSCLLIHILKHNDIYDARSSDNFHISSIAFSFDGSHIVSADEKSSEREGCSIKMWDTRDGQCKLMLMGHHTHTVSSVAFNSDGSRIVSKSFETIKVWDAKNGECLRTIGGHNNHENVIFSPDSSRIVAGSSHGNTNITVWDIQSGQCEQTFEGHTAPIKSLVFSPDELCIISGSCDKNIKLWDAKSGECKLSFVGHTDDVNCVAFSPGGSQFVSGSKDNSVKLWDAKSGRCERTFMGHTRSVSYVGFSADGARIVSTADYDGFRLWDATSSPSERNILVGHTKPVTSLAFSLNGLLVVSGSQDGTVKLWDARNGQCFLSLTGHSQGITTVAFAPDGLHIASGSEDKSVKVWDAKSGQCLFTVEEFCNKIDSVNFNADSSRLLCSSSGSFQLWDVKNGQHICTLTPRNMNCVAFSSDGLYFVTSGDNYSIKLLNFNTGQCERTFYGHAKWIMDISLSRDGTRIVSGSDDNSVKLWDAKSGQCERTFNHTSSITCVTFSPDSLYIASGSKDGSVKLWDAKSGQCEHTFSANTDRVNCVAFSPNGKYIASVNEYSGITVRNVKTGKCERIFTEGSHYLAFSHDNLYVVGREYSIKQWDLKSGQCVRTFGGYTHNAHCVAFNSDNSKIVSAHWDGIRIWNVKNGRCESTLGDERESFYSVAISIDDSHILSSGADGEVKRWDAKSGKCKTVLRRMVGPRNAIFSPDGFYVALSGNDDGSIQLLDSKNGECKQILLGHTDDILGISFNSDGTHLISADSKRIVKLWDTHTAQCIRTLTLTTDYHDVCSISLSSDNSLILGKRDHRGPELLKIENNQLVECLSAIEHIFSEYYGKQLPLWDTHETALLLAQLCSFKYYTAVDWRQTANTNYLVTGDYNHNVRLFRLQAIANSSPKQPIYRAILCWTSQTGVLMAEGTCFDNAIGLSADNENLLRQRGAKGNFSVQEHKENKVAKHQEELKEQKQAQNLQSPGRPGLFGASQNLTASQPTTLPSIINVSASVNAEKKDENKSTYQSNELDIQKIQQILKSAAEKYNTRFGWGSKAKYVEIIKALERMQQYCSANYLEKMDVTTYFTRILDGELSIQAAFEKPRIGDKKNIENSNRVLQLLLAEAKKAPTPVLGTRS